ncbi:hypothetical protein Y032_1028g3431 [Ancylostoma ceylanicum]|uniref:Uncharacterized protein n=1 Tax=Ancylostoma ceylanicum TaxID=53326 RepID=A0A016W9A6_9BILA|nr:hypothetical protein Y032_1028g3431 [Ancylostoma ceylanicum]
MNPGFSAGRSSFHVFSSHLLCAHSLYYHPYLSAESKISAGTAFNDIPARDICSDLTQCPVHQSPQYFRMCICSHTTLILQSANQTQ